MVLTFIWKLPAKILNYVEPRRRGSRKPARCRPLHTCGSSCLSIARKACTKAQDLDEPLGSMTKTSITLFNSFFPCINSMVHQCLAMLLIIDDQILSVESKIERIVPRSAFLFDGVDKLVCCAEALPEQLDALLNRFPSMFPLLHWVLIHLIWFLNILLSTLIQLGSKNAREKEITVDDGKANAVEHTKTVQFERPYSYADAARNHTEIPKSVQFEDNGIPQTTKAVPTEVIHLSVKRLHSWKTRIKALEEPLSAGDSPMYSSYQSANSSPVSDCSQEENHPFSQLGCTYKEILERDKKEDEEREGEEGERVEEGVLHKKEEEEDESKCYVATQLTT